MTCPQCQEPVPQLGRGRPRRFCTPNCKRRYATAVKSEAKQAARRAATLPCLTCGEMPGTPVRGPIPTYCSVFCTEVASGRKLAQAYPDRVCALRDCSAVFTPQSRTQECCSELHGKRHWKHKERAAGRPTVNPETRRRALRRKTQRRRAATFAAEAEPVDRDVVGERDGWVCGLCGQQVDNALAYPDPMSPSLDHVLPLSLGGAHTYANVQITHFRCNVAKSNKVA